MDILPPEPEAVPPPPVSSFRRAIAAFEHLAQAEPWSTLRSEEDVLVDAKSVDVRVRSGEPLPLAGTLVAVDDTVDAAVVQRLTDDGAVLLGKAGPAAALESVDVAIGAPTRIPGNVGITPTRGLVPSGGGVAVFARTLTSAQRALESVTDPGAWPDNVRLGAGEHPRVAIPSDATFDATVATLRAAGARVTPSPADHDALFLPPGAERPVAEHASVAVTAGEFVVPAFDDQVAIDLAAVLTGEQAENPYPATGIELVVFGEQVRGRPLNARLAARGARFAGAVTTAERYRMVALPTVPPTPGVLPADDGAALNGERWLISPAGLGRFTAELTETEVLGRVELADGSTVLGVLCQGATEATDITAYEDWRAYLRHLSTLRPGA